MRSLRSRMLDSNDIKANTEKGRFVISFNPKERFKEAYGNVNSIDTVCQDIRNARLLSTENITINSTCGHVKLYFTTQFVARRFIKPLNDFLTRKAARRAYNNQEKY